MYFRLQGIAKSAPDSTDGSESISLKFRSELEVEFSSFNLNSISNQVEVLTNGNNTHSYSLASNDFSRISESSNNLSNRPIYNSSFVVQSSSVHSELSSKPIKSTTSQTVRTVNPLASTQECFFLFISTVLFRHSNTPLFHAF